MIKFPTPNKVGSLRGSQYESRDCYHKAVKEFRKRRYEGKGLPFEDAEDIQKKPSGEVYAHYFMEGLEEEETHATETPVLMMGNVLRIRSVEEVVMNHIERIMQKEVNGEKLEGRRGQRSCQALDRNVQHSKELSHEVKTQKCVFGVESGKFLGINVNHRGIEANPAKTKALLDMKYPINVKQVQSLTGRIAALNRFVSKSSDRCKEFFKAIKVTVKDFVWTPKCEEAFRKIKEQLGNPPILSKPLDGESLILYLAVSEYSISVVLVREEDTQQSPVYYVSKRLHDVKTRYTSIEKMVYAFILASRKLRPYFQAHKIEVRTTYPLRQVLHKPESSGRILKWAMELGQFDLEYMPRTAIKGQALADFLLEFDSAVDDKALVVLHPPHTEESLEEFPHPWWILHVDGAVNNGGAGAGIVLMSPEGHHLMSAIHFKFYATNNDAEYEALISGLKIALEMGVQNLIVKSDSELVVNQVNGGFQARGSRTKLYLTYTQRLIGKFKEEIPRIPEVEAMQVDETPKETWMTPILAYIYKGALPEGKSKVRRLHYQAARFVVYDEVLYKRGFNQPLLRCLDEEEGNYILREVHEVICGNHSGGNSLVMKVLRQGYYYPTMKEDAENFVRACDRCQRFANYSSMPTTLLTPMVSP
ncbi:uncharacterized protein LOC141673971 [Apium graveolens]|uniref:uncharacterized protein LOC141673971 n=1 Tax=Apium graveolens TaxID=4045 RepID=UPI003D78DFAC